MLRQAIQMIHSRTIRRLIYFAEGDPMNNRNRTLRKDWKQNEKKEDKPSSPGRRGTTYRDPDSPPNDHIQKDPDEVYGDTKILHRGSK
jgi:hypothetical protein